MEETNYADRIRAAIKKAASAYGGVTKLALALGITRSVLYFHIRDGHLPDKHIVRVERLTGVPRQELRPDLYE